jgi:polyhydroxyalkanoate synthesis regulator protein
MEPLNDAANAISDQHRARWVNPIETLPANGGMNEQEMQFMKNMMQSFAQQSPAPANTSVSIEAYNELKDRLAKLEVLLASQQASSAPTAARRA